MQALKTNIIVNASLALKSKSSKQLMNYINKINEYVAELCGCLNISLRQVENKRGAKESKVGGFNNGYVLEQTVLKDNIIDETLEFNPVNCKKIHEIERENTKYFEFLENLEKIKNACYLDFLCQLLLMNGKSFLITLRYKKCFPIFKKLVSMFTKIMLGD